MPEKHQPFITSLGHIVFDTVRTSTTAVINGITSKGGFAITPDKHILFFSLENYRGPLTINLQNFKHQRFGVSFNSSFSLSPTEINFTDKDVALHITSSTPVWSPPDIPQIFPSHTGLLDRVRNINKIVEWHSPEIYNLSNKIRPLLRSGKFDQAADKLEAIIGYGTGLTPSGDDFICGFLLAAFYWYGQVLPVFPLVKIKDQLLDIARQSTTTLSTNLISCAAQGTADERILSCLHWLNNGTGDIDLIIEELRAYGSSSGIDTLLGVLTFIQAALG